MIDDVYVFCSDEEIMNYIPKGVKFLKRNRYLDGDLVQGNEIYESFIRLVDSDIYLLAHTTSPFLTYVSVKNALINVLNKEYDSALSVQKKQTFIWYKGSTLNYECENVPRTQDIEPIYVETSGFYIFQKNHFLSHEEELDLTRIFKK